MKVKQNFPIKYTTIYYHRVRLGTACKKNQEETFKKYEKIFLKNINANIISKWHVYYKTWLLNK